jgi:hypothetical protein
MLNVIMLNVVMLSAMAIDECILLEKDIKQTDKIIINQSFLWALVRFVCLTFHQLAILSNFIEINIPFCHFAISLTCHFINLQYCHLAT